MPRVTIHVRKFPRILTRSGTRDLMDRAALSALLELGARSRSLIREGIRSNVDSRGFRGRIDTGITINAVTAGRPTKIGQRWVQDTFIAPPAANWAHVIELGRRPRKRAPPRDPILRWVRRSTKGQAIVTAMQAEWLATHPERVRGPAKEQFETRAAVLLQRSIARKGIPGIFPFKVAAQRLREGIAANIYRQHLRAAREALRG